MKRFSIIAAAIFTFLLTVPNLAQPSLVDLFTGSFGQEVFLIKKAEPKNPTPPSKAGENLIPTVSNTVVISQIYGGAGCGTAGCSTYKNDYIELFNRGNSAQSLNGWSVQYTSSTGTAWQVTNLTNVTLQPGQYYLVQQGAGVNGVNNLPTPDATGTIAMSATSAKVALVNNTTALSGQCGAGATIPASVVDFVGYGTTANCNEGGANAAAPSTVTADLRAGSGCTDTDNNGSDFAAVAPNPRNTATALNPCSVPVNLSINDVSLNEGNSGTTAYTFTVSLSSPAPAGGVTFDIATGDGTATAGIDYVQKSLIGQTITAGNSTYTFDVTVNGDTTVEPNETFFVNVTNVTGANVTDGQGQGTIVNDDVANNPPTITPQSGVFITKGVTQNNVTIATVTDENAGAVSVSVTSANPSNNITLSNLTNTNGTITATVAATCGASDASFTLSASDGVNPAVTATLNVGAADGAASGLIFSQQPTNTTSGATITPAVAVQILSSGGCVVPVSAPDVTLSLTGSPTATLNGTLTVSPVNGVATFGDLSVNAPGGASNLQLVASANGLTGVTSASFIVMSLPPTVSFEFLNYQEDESQTLEMRVLRAGDTSGTTTVQYSVPLQQTLGAPATGGASCTMGVDYVTPNGTLTFEPGDTEKFINVPICGDTMVEGVEVFPVQLSNPTNATLGEITTAHVDINDTASQFANTDQITIGFGNDGNPYPSEITVSGAPSVITSMRLTLYDFSHFNSDRLDLLLVGPQGQKFIIMGDAGGNTGLGEPATITFADSAMTYLPDNAVISTGSYKPTSWELVQSDFPAPAPAGPYVEPYPGMINLQPEGDIVPTFASTFGGTNPNGNWQLYIRDDGAGQTPPLFVGIGGFINGGWALQFVGPTAASVSVGGQLTVGKNPVVNQTVMLTGGNLTEPRYVKTNSLGNYTFEGLEAGQTYIVTVLAGRYYFPNPTRILNVEDSVFGADFEAEER